MRRLFGLGGKRAAVGCDRGQTEGARWVVYLSLLFTDFIRDTLRPAGFVLRISCKIRHKSRLLDPVSPARAVRQSVIIACVVCSCYRCQLALSDETNTHTPLRYLPPNTWVSSHGGRYSDATMILYFLLPQMVLCNNSVLQNPGSPVGVSRAPFKPR